jgi:uncharacterized membrane protein YebE (DUF533 family)
MAMMAGPSASGELGYQFNQSAYGQQPQQHQQQQPQPQLVSGVVDEYELKVCDEILKLFSTRKLRGIKRKE